MTWTRFFLVLGLAAALVLGIKTIRASDVARGDKQGSARVQQQWDKQKAFDDRVALEREEQRSRDQAAVNRNAERVTNEEAKRNAARDQRLAVSTAALDRVRSVIDRLNRGDLSEAAGDPRFTALAKKLATARELLGSCDAAQQGVASEADRLKDQVIGLQDFAINVCRAGAPSTALSAPGDVLDAR